LQAEVRGVRDRYRRAGAELHVHEAGYRGVRSDYRTSDIELSSEE